MRKKEAFFWQLPALMLSALIMLQNDVYAEQKIVEVSEQQQSVVKQQLQGATNNKLKVTNSEITLTDFVSNTYQINQYKLLWTKKSLVDILLKAIEASFQHGLVPDDYHLTQLNMLLNKGETLTSIETAQLDILLTDALFRLSYHLNFGKVVPGSLDSNWNLRRDFLTKDPVAIINYVLSSETNLAAFLKQNIQLGPFYQGLIKALAHYRQIQQEGGWQTIPSGPTLKPGMIDVRVPQIKVRLQSSGDLQRLPVDSTVHLYDETLEAGVKHFQQRHHLEVDGIIGKTTLEAMNIPVAERIDQIRANLERVRWVNQNIEDEFVLVNIAGYKVYYFKDNKMLWSSRAQVGRKFRKTPVFRDDISHVVFNPTWTVPPTILKKDVLPKIRQDPEYLIQKNMVVVDAQGNIIDTDTIDWSEFTAHNFPYFIRQEPGAANALGRVKIMFPNKHLVYLHDTPSQANFKKAKRAFSSGCIRIQNPFQLVELLLKNKNKWNQSKFDKIVDKGEMQYVNLPHKVPILLLYFTAQLNDKGEVTFHRDIYRRDENIIKGLYEPFKLVQPEQKL